MTDRQTIDVGSIQLIFWSPKRGMGKTVALASYKRGWTDKPTRRLMIDMERRSRQYRSPDEKDHPEMLYWAFDYFHDVYREQMPQGRLTIDAIGKLYTDIVQGKLPYDAILIDNVVRFQDWWRVLLTDPSNGQKKAIELAKRMDPPVYRLHRHTLATRYRVTDNSIVYTILKAMIDALLDACQVARIDVISSSEEKNDYGGSYGGTRKVKGKTVKVLKPWLAYAEAVYELSRITGSQSDGSARLTAIPRARITPDVPKNSMPGVPPMIAAFTWDNYWDAALSRNIATAEDFAKIEIPIETDLISDEDIEREAELDAAKAGILSQAAKLGLIKGRDDAEGIPKLISALATYGLSPDEAVLRRDEIAAALEEMAAK